MHASFKNKQIFILINASYYLKSFEISKIKNKRILNFKFYNTSFLI